MATQPPCAPLAPETLPVITYQGKPVVTTDMLAKLYGTAETNIHDNHRKNADRFEEGKHFFKLSGQAFREFINLQPENFRSQISSKARNLILWTERGAARHAKMLETDQAWEVFEKLEDCYFGKKEANQPAPAARPAHPPTITRSRILLTLENGQVVKSEPVPTDAEVCSPARFRESVALSGYRLINPRNWLDVCEILAMVGDEHFPTLADYVAARLAGDTAPQPTERHG